MNARNDKLLTYVANKMQRFTITRGKVSTKNLVTLCEENATDQRTLIVHTEDVDFRPYFPNSFMVTKREHVPADMHVDTYYRQVSEIESASYDVVLCTGLLEHIPDPQRLVDEFRRILTPGGRLIMSASAVFSFHEGPDNFFHFTPYGLQILFKDWSKIETLRGSSQPFETIGILIQRIHHQCDIFPLARPFIEALYYAVPLLDVFVTKQYDSRRRIPERQIDSMMPSNMQAVVIK